MRDLHCLKSLQRSFFVFYLAALDGRMDVKTEVRYHLQRWEILKDSGA